MTQEEDKKLEEWLFKLAKNYTPETTKYVDKSIKNALIRYERRKRLFFIIKIIVGISILFIIIINSFQ